MSHNVLGIIGGGQLALYIARSAVKRDVPFQIHAQNSDDPAATAYPQNCSFGPINDAEALSKAMAKCSHIALESEFWRPSVLKKALTGKKVCPELDSYELIYGKIAQRQLMTRLDIPQPRYRIVHNENECRRAFESFDRSVIIKCNTDGYDGLGNRYANTIDDLLSAAKFFKLSPENPALIESALNLTRELALTFFASSGHISFFPPVETIQEDHVCTTAISPANLAAAERERLESVAKLLVTAGLHGLYTIEFFREERGPWRYNEIAPRPHNSQHLSMDNCNYSQYDAIIAWVKNERLPERITPIGDAAMVNILGKTSSATKELQLPEVGVDIELKTYMYGKKESRPGRKLGHLTLLGPRERILNEALRMSREYNI